jgi:preprotein translocase subunit YajC
MNQSSASSLIWLLLIGFMVYLMWSQYRARKRTTDMLSSLSEGDEVVTVGGVYGTIEKIEGDVLDLRVANGVVLRVARAAVSGKVASAEPPEEEEQ